MEALKYVTMNEKTERATHPGGLRRTSEEPQASQFISHLPENILMDDSADFGRKIPDFRDLKLKCSWVVQCPNSGWLRRNEMVFA